ncbi:regulator of chromosome condensation 1/beta-lactamase-inhibitor protein II [Scleroderma yunnanense]
MIYTPTQILLPTNCTIISVAPGQDHTLALTSAGEVISWGLNRFCQLGYVVESGQGGSTNEPVQTTPRKITHLKKEFVKGVAACKSASACWSDDQVKTATPVQIYPRQVSVITQPVYGIAMTETAMVCLFKTGDVVCLWHGGVSKINFPAHSFPSEMSVYRPPQAVRGTAITKLPQRVWALGRQFNCVRDVDIGGDGTLIVCTQSGHVYVRSRKLKASTAVGGSKPFRFQRIAHIQRAVAVCTNNTGAFGAPPPLHVVGNSMEADMAAIAPYIRDGGSKLCANVATTHVTSTEDDIEDAMILNDIETLKNLMNELDLMRERLFKRPMAPISRFVSERAWMFLHRLILASRCKPLQAVLTNNSILEDTHSGLTISFRASTTSSPFLGYLLVAEVSPLSLLVLLHYLYSDDLLALWDRRIGVVFADQFNDFGISSAQVKAELTTLVGILELRQLSQVLRSVVKRVPVSTTREDYQQLFDQAQGTSPPTSRKDTCVDVLAPDVALHLNDKVIYTHSVILRARCPFFSAFFGDLDWTVHRRDCFGVVDVQMGHLTFRFRHQGVWRHPPCLLSLAMTCYGLLWVWGIPWSIKQPIATTSKRQTDPSWQNRSLLP